MKRIPKILSALLLSVGLMLPAHASVAHGSDVAPADSSDESVALQERNDTGLDVESVQQDEPTLDVSVNGSLRFNVLFRSYGAGQGGNFEAQADRVLGDGGFTFDTFRIGASGSYGSLIFDLEYAFYPASFGTKFIHHGWVGYEFSDAFQTQVGVSQVPFGIQPYASSSWFFNYTYYVGLEDDYDAGIKAVYQSGNWDLQGAYYMNSEQTFFFGSTNASRYSYDVVPSTRAGYIQTRGISEEHQLNAKAAYSFNHGDVGFTKVGASGQIGQLLNRRTGGTGSRSAWAVHFQGRYQGFEAKLEYAQQSMNPPDVNDDRFVVMGAYGSPYRVASEIDVISSSLAYHVPVDIGPISEIKPYYDYSRVGKEISGWNDNASHILGFLTSSGPVFVYTDLIVSKGHPFNQPFDATYPSVLAQQRDNEWQTAFNINIGIYF